MKYKFQSESNQVEERESLNILSTQLKDEVIAASNLKIVNAIELIVTRYSRMLIDQMPFALDEQIFGPDEIIV